MHILVTLYPTNTGKLPKITVYETIKDALVGAKNEVCSIIKQRRQTFNDQVLKDEFYYSESLDTFTWEPEFHRVYIMTDVKSS